MNQVMKNRNEIYRKHHDICIESGDFVLLPNLTILWFNACGDLAQSKSNTILYDRRGYCAC